MYLELTWNLQWFSPKAFKKEGRSTWKIIRTFFRYLACDIFQAIFCRTWFYRLLPDKYAIVLLCIGGGSPWFDIVTKYKMYNKTYFTPEEYAAGESEDVKKA